MKQRISAFCLFLMMLLSLGFRASAIEVKFEWDIPGSVAIQLESTAGEYVDLLPDQTSYTLESIGWCYIYGADGYIVTGAISTDGKYTLTPFTNNNGIVIGEFFGAARDGVTYKVSVEKVIRNDAFTVDVVNGLSYISARFSSGYELDLQEGSHTYTFNPDIDGKMTLSLSDIAEAYKVTLNGVEVQKNNFYPRYEGIEIKAGDDLLIHVFEGAEPEDCTFTIEYGDGMDGCLVNIYNRSTGNFIYAEDLVNNSLTVKENTELRVNLHGSDYEFTHLLLNGDDIISTLKNDAVTFFVTENTTLKIEGSPIEFGIVDFTGYIINAEGLSLSYTYGGESFVLPEGEAVESDINAGGLTMPAALTKKYIIPISEKNPQFFFAPKQGYYISNLYMRTPEGKTEQHSGYSSINANIDGTTFYMILEKLPEEYTADLNIIGDEFYIRSTAGGVLSSVWGNPAVPGISVAPGEQTLSFLPGYGTPITFGITCDESMSPAVYLDGAEVVGVTNSDSGAKEYSVTPYSPASGADQADDIHSTIRIYNSAKERPQMSGASLLLENGASGEFYYSPVMHVANPSGQPVISGTQFTVRPTTPNTIVMYKDEIVSLNDNGEFVFSATGNARNNVVKLTVMDYNLTPASGSTVEYLDEIVLSFPKAQQVDFVGESYSFVLQSGPYFVVPGMNCEKVETAEIPTFRLSLPDDLVVPIGYCSLRIEEATFMIDGVPSVEINASYNVEREASVEYTQTPESTIVYQDFGYDFAFVFDETTTVGNPDLSKIKVTLDDAVLTADADYSCMPEGNYLMFMVTNPEYIKPGVLKVEIEEGAFNLSGTMCPAITGQWNVVAPRTFTVEVTPKDVNGNGDANDLSEITILFHDATSGEVFIESGAHLNNKDYSYSQTGVITIDESSAEGVKCTITFNPAPESKSEYFLFVNEGTITLDGAFPSPLIEESFMFDKETSVVSILANDNGNVTVVTVDGKVLLEDAPAVQLRGLDKGIYIINGKKVYVK